MQIKKILENRDFSVKKDPYQVFEKKIVNSFYLERKIMMMKFGKKEQYQSRIQLVVYLVSCLEYFLQEIFKLSIENGMIPLGKLKEVKNLKSVKANVDELQEIKKNNIKLSEILVEEMNFQNIKDIILLCDLLKIVKNFKNLPRQKKNNELLKLKGDLPNPRKKHSPNIEKQMTKFIINNFGADFALPKDQEKLIRTVNTVYKMILLRHKIVHKAHLVKIDNWESFAYTMTTVQLAFIVNECYKIELRKIKIKKQK